MSKLNLFLLLSDCHSSKSVEDSSFKTHLSFDACCLRVRGIKVYLERQRCCPSYLWGTGKKSWHEHALNACTERASLKRARSTTCMRAGKRECVHASGDWDRVHARLRAVTDALPWALLLGSWPTGSYELQDNQEHVNLYIGCEPWSFRARDSVKIKDLSVLLHKQQIMGPAQTTVYLVYVKQIQPIINSKLRANLTNSSFDLIVLVKMSPNVKPPKLQSSQRSVLIKEKHGKMKLYKLGFKKTKKEKKTHPAIRYHDNLCP